MKGNWVAGLFNTSKANVIRVIAEKGKEEEALKSLDKSMGVVEQVQGWKTFNTIGEIKGYKVNSYCYYQRGQFAS
jgi:hypothetical protein